MNTFLNFISFIFLIVASIGTGYGFDLKKWKSWLYILSGFLFGVLQLGGIGAGIVIALLMIWAGPIALKQRE
ncbi:MAG: hypothetical protein WCC12_20235 [Anaerolineales bacterium]